MNHERIFALEMLNRLDGYIRENLPRLSFPNLQELRAESACLMFEYKIRRAATGYILE